MEYTGNNQDFWEHAKDAKDAFSMQMVNFAHFDLRKIRLLALIAIQTTTVQITGSAPDGNYTVTISGTDVQGNAFSVELEPFVASGSTNNAIAAGIEALIAAARADELADYLTNETVSTNTVTAIFITGVQATISLQVPVGATATIARSFSAVVTPGLRIRESVMAPSYPEHVIREHCVVHRKQAITGLTAITLIVGDAAVTDGLFTSTSLASAGSVRTSGATETRRRYEQAFAPRMEFVSTTTPFGSATAGEVVVEIGYTPAPVMQHEAS